jgi:hypothetical protein
MGAKKTARRAEPIAEGEPSRVRSVQKSFRLSPDEDADLQMVINAWVAKAREQGFPEGGFADWLVSVIREKKAALTPEDKPKGKR